MLFRPVLCCLLLICPIGCYALLVVGAAGVMCYQVGGLVAEVLTEREADIIRRRYGLDGRLPQTQKQVAALYGISRSYVSRGAYCK